MAKGILVERAADLRSLRAAKAGALRQFAPQLISHVYVKLDFKPQYENAGTADDAKGFLRSVFRAAQTAHRLSLHYNGLLLEVQGSMLHVGITHNLGITESIETDRVRAFVGDLHWAYRDVFNDPKLRVEGWRMTIDAGNTLVVVGPGVHGDASLVSLGTAANRPAKHLYAQLDLSETDRQLRRFYMGKFNPAANRWTYESLDRMPTRLIETKAIAEEARRGEPKLGSV